MTPEQKQIEKQIRHEVPGLLNNLPRDKREQIIDFLSSAAADAQRGGIVQHTAQVTHTTTSPVPPAELLEGYNRSIPDGGNRLFSLIERQSSHRQELELMAVQTQCKATLRGQWAAVAMTLVLSAIGVYFGVNGHDKISATIFASTIIAVATLFIVGRAVQQQDLARKAPPANAGAERS